MRAAIASLLFTLFLLPIACAAHHESKSVEAVTTALVTINGIYVQNNNQIYLKKGNETYLLVDNNNIIKQHVNFQKNALIQSFRICLTGRIVPIDDPDNHNYDHVIYVNGLCDKS